jgi:predicted enzyme related to lactoylglutathione lyase
MSNDAEMSEYILFFRNTGWHKELSPEQIEQNIGRFTAWFEHLNETGKFKSGGPLGFVGNTLISKTDVVDGPFVEVKEAIAGYFIIQAANLAEALEIAKGCPGLDYGQTVEVRPIVAEAEELGFARAKAGKAHVDSARPATPTPSSLPRGIDAVYYMVKDLPRARKFYEEGLRFQPTFVSEEGEWQGVEYTLPTGQTFGLGLSSTASWSRCGGVMISVGNVEEHAGRVTQFGGKVLLPPTEGPVCFISQCEDTEGNAFVLHHRKDGTVG